MSAKHRGMLACLLAYASGVTSGFDGRLSVVIGLVLAIIAGMVVSELSGDY